MSNKGKIPVTKKILIQDLIFVVGFFWISYVILRPSVPVDSAFWITFWSVMVGLAMTGVAWLSLWMFRIVLLDQIDRQKAPASKK
ncbi:MAG TPA: hypothetical protein VK041_04820 [Opitutales bacterium]|nr:hypothetical protein [Opitutales bacterium]